MSNKAKSRYFTFLLYPESIPEDWEIKLETLGMPIAISPLHDKDRKEGKEKGYKKAHYHVIYVTPNPVTAHSVRMRIKRLLGEQSVALVQIVASSMENMYLYLTHESKDAVVKNKHVYNKKDIKLINNFDIDRYIVLDEVEKNEILDLIIELIFRFRIENLYDFWEFYYENKDAYALPNKREMNSIIKSNTGFLRLNFDGVYQRNKKSMMLEEEKNK